MRLFELEEKNGFGHEYLRLNLKGLEPRVLEVSANRGLELDEAGELGPGESLLQLSVEYMEYKHHTFQASAVMWLALGPEDAELLKLLVARTPYQNRSNALTPKGFSNGFVGLTWCQSKSAVWDNRGLRTEASKRKKKAAMRQEAVFKLDGLKGSIAERFVTRLKRAVAEYNQQFIDRTHNALKEAGNGWGFESEAVLVCDKEADELTQQIRELQNKRADVLKERQAARNKEMLDHYQRGNFGFMPPTLAVEVETSLREGRCFEVGGMGPVDLW